MIVGIQATPSNMPHQWARLFIVAERPQRPVYIIEREESKRTQGKAKEGMEDERQHYGGGGRFLTVKHRQSFEDIPGCIDKGAAQNLISQHGVGCRTVCMLAVREPGHRRDLG